MARLQPIPVSQYDPNLVPATARLYGVYDGYAFHVTPNRASAIQKVYARSECSIWESVNGRWVLRGRKTGWPKAGDACDNCQHPLLVDPNLRPYYTHGVGGRWCFVRGPGGKINDPLDLRFMCPDCVRYNES